jgi:outer membrane protein TolC
MAEEVRRQEAERYARGISQQIDVSRARSNAMVRRSTLLRSQEKYKLAMDRLKLLLNWNQLRIDSASAVIPVEVPQIRPMTIDESDVIERALANRPELVKAKQALMIREADETLANHQRLPKLDAFGRYSVSGYGDAFDDAWRLNRCCIVWKR